MLQTITCRVDIAAEYGVDVAVFVHSIYLWVAKNAAEKKHFHDGRYWSYASYSGMAEWFAPLWSIQQIKRIVAKCREKEILLVADYNEEAYVHTNWYALSDKIMEIYGNVTSNKEVVRIRTIDSSNSDGSGSKANQPNKEVLRNNTLPPIAPQGGRGGRRTSPRAAPDWKPERFEGLWDYYPHDARGNRQRAIAAWDKLRPSDDLIAEIGHCLRRLMASERWQAGVGIPHVSTFLNPANERWKDAYNLDDGRGRGCGREEVAFGWQ